MGRALGLGLLAAGIGLVVMGLNASHSVSERLHETLVGGYSNQTTAFIIGGIALGVGGLGLLIFGGGSGKR